MGCRMKKKTIIYVIANIILAIITGLLSIKTDYGMLTLICKYCSLTFAFIAFIILLVSLYEKLLKKDNSKLLLIICTACYVIFSIVYGVIIYTAIGGDLLRMCFMITFYISLISLIFTYSSVFYFWISKNNIKYIVRALVVLLVMIALCLIFTLISKHIQVSSMQVLIFNFIYVTSILLFSAFLITFIVNKLVLPIDKK